MRIKRFIAPDMRTALRMVRDEQGPDAVILSNRATADGIEVVAALDYDESLVTQALRAAAPGLEPVVASSAVASSPVAPAPVPATAPRFVARPVVAETTSAVAASSASIAVARPSRSAAARPVTDMPAQTAVAEPVAAPRESLMSRARAIFKIGDGPDAASDGPTLAELTSATPNATTVKVSSEAAMPEHPTGTREPVAAVAETSRFDAMMAAFDTTTHQSGSAQKPSAEDAVAADTVDAPAPVAGCNRTSDADYLISLASASADVSTRTCVTGSREADVSASVEPAPRRTLQSVAIGTADASDPAIIAMRRELATMRELMEKQMEQLSLERLRGAPARAAVFETLKGYGCDEKLAQAVAAAIDPRLSPSDIREPMFAGLMNMLTLARSEPVEDGGVIALVGPTGAGKTTTAAKLAARFAARHRARDIALVSIDRERTGAREQLHAHGRRLGVTVCDADNSDALGHALEQLVDYPLVLVDTAGYGVRDRALLRQILWLRSASRVRSLLVLPANAHPHDLGEIVRRYRPAAPEGVVLTKLDETGRLGAALSVLAQHDIPLAYTTAGQQVPADLDAADAAGLIQALQKTPGAADNPFATEERHALV